jgi:predicted nucleic acid-binding Zn ribbon protein
MPHAKGFAKRRDRRSDDVVPLGEVVDQLMAERTFSRGIPIATLASEWRGVMGERLAAETEPRSFDNGVLTVTATNGPWGAQARFLAEQVRLNANEVLGADVVRVVRVVVDPGFRGGRKTAGQQPD